MEFSPRQLAYTVLQRQSCGECSADIDFNELEIKTGKETDFGASYQCTDCGTTFQIEIQVEDDTVETEIRDNDGNPVVTNITPRGSLYQEGHPAEQLVEELHHLHSIFEILSTNYERVSELEDRLPEVFEQVFGQTIYDIRQDYPTKNVVFSPQRSAEWRFLDTEVHNYLATAYSFGQILESIRPKVEWTSQIDRKFSEYKSQTKVVLGLRHYVQHEGVIPLKFRLNNNDSEREVDVLVPLEEIKEMQSQKPIHPPDGYKNGSNHHYSNVEGEYVNISKCFTQYTLLCGRLSMQIAETTLEKKGEEINEFENYTSNLPNYDELI